MIYAAKASARQSTPTVTSLTDAMAPRAIIAPMRIGVALFHGAEELDWAGPWEVFSMWSLRWPADGVTVTSVAESADSPITCAKGMRVLANESWDRIGALDLLVYPGGEGTTPQLQPGSPAQERLRSLAQSGTIMASVCTGSLVFAAAGLLAGRPATTHWRHLDRLRALEPSAQVRGEDRFVDAGQVVTSAGVSAGIDMALYLISRLNSQDRAREVRRAIQYDPRPPV